MTSWAPGLMLNHIAIPGWVKRAPFLSETPEPGVEAFDDDLPARHFSSSAILHSEVHSKSPLASCP